MHKDYSEIKANTKYISLEKYQLADKSESDNAIFIGSCTLQENNLQGNKHRVLIIKSDSEYTKYHYFLVSQKIPNVILSYNL